MTELKAPPGYVNFNDEMLFKLYVESAPNTDTQPLDPLIPISQNKAYPGKSLIGDPTVATHDYLSTWGVSDLSGGLGIHDHRAGMTDQRYRRSTGAVDRPGAWTTQIRPLKTEAGAGDFMVIGDLYKSGAVHGWCCAGTEISELVLDNDYIPALLSFASAPVNPGVAFQGTSGSAELYVPLGTYGYGVWTGTVVTSVPASASKPKALYFWIFGAKLLMCLDTDGQLWSSPQGSTWTAIGVADSQAMKIDGAFRAKSGYEYRDASGEPISEIVTSGGVFAFDLDGPSLIRTGWRWPRHPRSGLAAEVHEDTFYVATGLDIRALVSGSDAPIGINRDDGLEPEMTDAYIVGLASEYNALWALVKSPRATGYNALYRFDGLGWFEVWSEESSGSDTVTGPYVSEAGGLYGIAWGVNEFGYRLQLPISDTNPRTMLYEEAFLFWDDAYLETGMTNHGMPGSQFTGVSASIRCAWVAGQDYYGVPLVPELPVVKYRTSRDGAWVTCTVTPDTTPVLPAAGETSGDVTLIYHMDDDFYGVVYEEIEFRIEWTQGCVIKWFAHYFMKQMAGSLGIDLMLDCTQSVSGLGGTYSPEQQLAYLDNLQLSGNIAHLSYGKNTINVGFTQYTGNDKSGQHEDRGIRKLALFEVRDRP